MPVYNSNTPSKMPSSDTDSWTDKKQALAGGHYARPLGSGSEESASDLSDWSDSEYLQDSVTQKRRHGVYFPRPPVWVTSSTRAESQFAGCMRCYASGEEECVCGSNSLRETSGVLDQGRETYPWSGDRDQRLFCKVTAATADALASIDASVSESATAPLVVDWDQCKPKWRNPGSIDTCSWPDCRISSDDPLSDHVPSEHSYRQVKPGLCTRLESQKDIRLGVGERWAIQEGSLVICIDSSYTLLEHERQPDEFEIIGGDVYVVCRLYADLWALCVKASLIPQSELSSHEETTTNNIRLAFLPLCAVTLAANFSAFSRRCSWYSRHITNDVRYPGNGLPVMPPLRSHSLTASKQIFRGNRPHLQLPDIVYDTFHNTSLSSDSDFIPLDSTLEQVFARVGSRRRRLILLGGRVSLHKIWNDVKASGVWKYSSDSRSSKSWKFKGGFRHYLGKK